MAGTRNKAQDKKQESQDALGMIYQHLSEASDVQSSLEAAQAQGDQEVLEFLRDYQSVMKDLTERARNLLGVRQARTQVRQAEPARAASQKTVEVQPHTERTSAGAQTNAQVKSGGQPGDDLVDEQSKESFPASDPSAKY